MNQSPDQAGEGPAEGLRGVGPYRSLDPGGEGRVAQLCVLVG